MSYVSRYRSKAKFISDKFNKVCAEYLIWSIDKHLSELTIENIEKISSFKNLLDNSISDYEDKLLSGVNEILDIIFIDKLRLNEFHSGNRLINELVDLYTDKVKKLVKDYVKNYKTT